MSKTALYSKKLSFYTPSIKMLPKISLLSNMRIGNVGSRKSLFAQQPASQGKNR